jgi:rubredoxin
MADDNMWQVFMGDDVPDQFQLMDLNNFYSSFSQEPDDDSVATTNQKKIPIQDIADGICIVPEKTATIRVRKVKNTPPPVDNNPCRKRVKESWIPLNWYKPGTKRVPHYFVTIEFNDHEYECEICGQIPLKRWPVYQFLEVSKLDKSNGYYGFTRFKDSYTFWICPFCYNQIPMKVNVCGRLASIDTKGECAMASFHDTEFWPESAMYFQYHVTLK